MNKQGSLCKFKSLLPALIKFSPDLVILPGNSAGKESACIARDPG